MLRNDVFFKNHVLDPRASGPYDRVAAVIGRLDPVLLWCALGFAALAIACAAALAVDAAPILGVHPALKPMKFAVSIAIFLATMAALVPALSISVTARGLVRWMLVVVMIVEIVAIVVQAMRGTTSHYNTAGRLDRALLGLMMSATVVFSIAMIGVALIATLRPLVDADGARLPALQIAAWRAGLWIFQLATVSGFAMGGRGRHTVGADDGGPGLALVNWSAHHGDLRVPHFLAMHALQVMPIVALVVGGSARGWIAVVATIGAYAAVVVWTLVRALAGLPAW